MVKLSRMLPVAVLVGLGALIFFARLHTYDEPLERDVTTYAVIAHEMLNDKVLYSDLWDHKPPGIHVTYAAAEVIAGYGRDSIFLMNITAALATLLACYFAGSALGGGWPGGLVAAGLWAIASGDLAIEANQPNTEVFLNASLATAFAVFVGAGNRSLGTRRALLIGFLFAIASLYKQIVIVEAVLLTTIYFAFSPGESRKKAFTDVVIIAAVGAAAWTLVLGYFFAQGRGQAFTQAVFMYNRYYAGSILRNLTETLSTRISLDTVAVILSIAILSAAGIILGLIFGPRRHWGLLVAFLVGTHIAVLLPGHSFPHYYQLWLPPLSIGAAWTVTLLKRILPVNLSWLSFATGGVACGILLLLEVPYYQASAETWSLKKYGTIFVQTDRLARAINHLLGSGETFYEWGSESGLYFTSGRRPPSGIVFADPMLSGPLAPSLTRRLIADLDRAKPDLVVIADQTLAQTRREHPIVEWLRQNYRPFSRTNMFLLLSRKGSKLDQRSGLPGEPANLVTAASGCF